jgi:hypothetical protein
MAAVASQLSFEVLRFAAEPVSSEVALLELEGRFRAGTRRRLGVPRLVAEDAEGSREIAPAAADEATAEPDGALWRATYAVGIDELASVFSLAVGRELLLGLPAPDAGRASGDREVRLAREANALRRTADEARDAASAALASAGAERSAREAVETELSEVRLARDDLTRRVAGIEEELAQVRREHAEELVRRDAERETALAGRDEEMAQAADDRVAEIEAEVAEARRALRAARAEAEGLRRDLERERERAEAAEAAVRRGRVTEIAGEPVNGHGDEDDDDTAQGLAADGDEGDRTARLGADGDEGDRTRPLAAESADEDQTARLGAANGDEDQTARLGAASDDDDRTSRFQTGRSDEQTAPLHANGAKGEATAPADRPTEVATLERPGPVEGSPGETVRVLGARRPRRTGEGPPADAAPGTAAIGARHIEPGQTPQRSALAAWLTRAVAFLALTIVVVAVLMVLKPF